MNAAVLKIELHIINIWIIMGKYVWQWKYMRKGEYIVRTLALQADNSSPWRTTMQESKSEYKYRFSYIFTAGGVAQ